MTDAITLPVEWAAITGCPGAGYIFWGDFQADVIGNPPGTPDIGKWTLDETAGRIRVATGFGVMFRHVRLTRTTNSGPLSLLGKACLTPASGSAETAAWFSMVSAGTPSAGTFSLRDQDGRILASVQYRPVGVLAYNGTVLPGVNWIRSIEQSFEIGVNLVTRRTSLQVNSVVVASNKKYVDPSAGVADRLELDLAGNDGSAMAWDSVRVSWQP